MMNVILKIKPRASGKSEKLIKKFRKTYLTDNTVYLTHNMNSVMEVTHRVNIDVDTGNVMSIEAFMSYKRKPNLILLDEFELMDSDSVIKVIEYASKMGGIDIYGLSSNY
jgi:thymidine kinase